MPKRLPAGKLRHVVSIRQHKIEGGTTAYDTFGQLSVSSTAWQRIAERRAAIDQLTGDEAIIARQMYPKATYRVTVDYDETLASTGGARRAVFFGSRMLHIGAVIDPDMTKGQLQLLCGEER